MYAHAILHSKAGGDTDSLRLSKDSLYSSFFSNKRLHQAKIGGMDTIRNNLNRVESTDSMHNIFAASNMHFKGGEKIANGIANKPGL